MSDFERTFIDTLLRPICTSPGARGLIDDVAMLRVEADRSLIATMDTIVEGVHFRAGDPLESVGWKALAVNVSDIMAKGALPRDALMAVNWPRGRDLAQATAFVSGLALALSHWDVALVGGDTVVHDGALSVTITLTGAPLGRVAGRAAEQAGQILAAGGEIALCVSGTIGAAALGLDVLEGRAVPGGDAEGWQRAYQWPSQPRRDAASVVAGMALAAMDVSDGLLIDAGRMAAASGCAALIALDAVPVPVISPDDAGIRLRLATGGDDYCVLMAVAADGPAPFAAPDGWTRVGSLVAGTVNRLTWQGEAMAWPARDGFVHHAD